MTVIVFILILIASFTIFFLFNTFVHYMLWIGGALSMGLEWVVGYNTENVTLDYRW
jgi:hypothetical protein